MLYYYIDVCETTESTESIVKRILFALFLLLRDIQGENIMETVLLKLVEQLNSSVFVLILILVFIMVAVFHIGKWKERFCTHENRLGKVETLSEKIIAISTKVDLIYERTNPKPMTQSYSPISLTPLGKENATNMKADEIFERIKGTLVQLVESTNPKNAYDIQTVSMNVIKINLLRLLNEEELIRIKNLAYQQGVLVEDFFGIFGVILRNHILQQKGIPISEIDKCDPAKQKS